MRSDASLLTRRRRARGWWLAAQCLAAASLVLDGAAAPGGERAFQVTGIGLAENGDIDITFPSEPFAEYFVDFAQQLAGPWDELPGQNPLAVGFESTRRFSLDSQGTPSGFFRVRRIDPPPADWTVCTVDWAGETGYNTSIAFDPEGHPAIAYIDRTARSVRMATLEDGSWRFETVFTAAGEGNVQFTSLTFDEGGTPLIAFAAGSLRFARRLPEGTWSIQTIDAGAPTPGWPSLRIDPGGQPAVAYGTWTSTTNTGTLKLARFNGASWTAGIVDPSAVCYTVNLEFHPDGRPVVAYGTGPWPGGDFKPVRFARFDGATWRRVTVESSANYFPDCSLAVAADGEMLIAYTEGAGIGELRLARSHDGVQWSKEDVGAAGSYSKIVIAPDGQPRIAFGCTEFYDLMFAAPDAGSWRIERIDSSGFTGWHVGLAFAPDGRPWISYNQNEAGDLKLAIGPPVELSAP